MDAGGKRLEYGRTHVVRPKGAHKATIVWLHGLGDNGARYATPSSPIPPPSILSLSLVAIDPLVVIDALLRLSDS